MNKKIMVLGSINVDTITLNGSRNRAKQSLPVQRVPLLVVRVPIKQLPLQDRVHRLPLLAW